MPLTTAWPPLTPEPLTHEEIYARTALRGAMTVATLELWAREGDDAAEEALELLVECRTRLAPAAWRALRRIDHERWARVFV